jgi:hypothetical protein
LGFANKKNHKILSIREKEMKILAIYPARDFKEKKRSKENRIFLILQKIWKRKTGFIHILALELIRFEKERIAKK